MLAEMQLIQRCFYAWQFSATMKLRSLVNASIDFCFGHLKYIAGTVHAASGYELLDYD